MIFEPGTLSLGVNYWESRHAVDMWREWDAETVERDFARLAEYGVRWVRCFPWWADFQPIRFMRTPGDWIVETRFADGSKLPDTEAGRAGVSETMMARFETFCDLAEKYGIRLIVCIMTGQMTFGLFTPPALAGLDLYTDPRALKWEAKYIRYFVTRVKAKTAIAAWESGNESSVLGPVQYAETGAVWMTFVNDIIRLADPSRPVIGVNDPRPSEAEGKWLVRDMAEVCDALSVHPYPMFDGAKIDEYTELRNVMDAAIQNRVLEDFSGRMSFIEETGVRRATAADAETQRGAMRSILWNAWACGAHAFLWWCAFDQSHLDIAPYDWPQPTLELGIFRADRTPLPAAEAFRDFAAFLQELPFGRLPDAKPDAVCITENTALAKTAGILAEMNGFRLTFRLPGQPIPDGVRTILLPSIAKRGGLSTQAWSELKRHVREDGATLYLSLDDCFLSDLDEVCGAAVRGCSEPGGTATYRFPDFEFTLPRPVRRRMKVLGAEVLASDAEGEPVFFRHAYGKGMVYTCAFAAEAIVNKLSGGYAAGVHRLYAFLAPARERLISTGVPHLLTSAHRFDEKHCVVLLRNCSASPAACTITRAAGWTVAGSYSETAGVLLDGDKLTMPGNTGLVLDLKADGK